MAVYYVLIAGAVLLGIPLCRNWGLSEKQTKFLRLTYCLAVGYALFVMGAIRRSTGYDYNLYAAWIHEMNFLSFEQLTTWSREKGFVIPIKILQVISQNWQPMFMLISLVIAAGVMSFIYKYSSIPYISVAAFLAFGFYFNSLNFMRQFIAGIIVAFALKYIYSNQPLRFIVLVLLASCFHFSALIIIPFYFILKIKINLPVLGIYTAVSILIFIFSEEIMLFITKYFYSAYDPLQSVHMLKGLNPAYTVIFGSLFLLMFCFRKPLIQKNKFNSILINALFFSAFFEFIGIKHSVISRFLLIFAIAPILILVPELIIIITDGIKKKFGKTKSLKTVLACCTFILFSVAGITLYTFLLSVNYNGVVPYKTVYYTSESEVADS